MFHPQNNQLVINFVEEKNCSSLKNIKRKSDLCQKEAFVTNNELLSYNIIERESYFSFHMIYYLYLYALSFQSYANWKSCSR